MDRRLLLAAGTVGAAFTAATSAVAQAVDHSKHQMASADHAHHGPGPYVKAATTAGACIETGQACLAHCIVLLGQGDKGMAACATSVEQMLATCRALQSLALQQSSLTPAMAKVAHDACRACEKECKKHESKHAECKACMQACDKCAQACKAIMA